MNIKELNGPAIKKALGCKSCLRRYHNKNKSGGNFGINIIDINGQDVELSGDYNTEGDVIHLRFGRLYHAGISISERNFDVLMDMIKRTSANVAKVA
jgi:hypothetical protein